MNAPSRIERLRGLVNRRAAPADERVLRRGDGRAAGMLHDIADRLRERSLFGGEQPREALHPEDVDALRSAIAAAVDGRGGEPVARARAVELGREYLTLDADGRGVFLEILATEHGIDPAAVVASAAAYRDGVERGEQPSDEPIRRALEAPSERLLQRFSSIDDGARFLLVMREHALAALEERPAIAPLERQLRRMLARWFDAGFLELRRITWDSPASLLERLTQYEAVHSIRSWDDLKHRLDEDRLVYGFFHPSMPLDPLLFVEVALVNGIADAVQPIIDETAPAGDPATADTAIFYSITNARRGLDGISLGGLLIKQVVDELKRDYPNLRTFSTLSPMPDFRAWLAEDGNLRIGAEEMLALTAAWHDWSPEQIVAGTWSDDAERAELVAPIVVRAAATYLLGARRPSGAALNRVEHFHLSNGARVERINWLGDTSANGMEQSLGVMVNYLYDLGEIEENHDAYTREHLIAASAAVIDLHVAADDAAPTPAA